MKRKICMIIMAIVTTIAAGYNVYTSRNSTTLSELALANVEALAACEIEGWVGNSTYRINFITLCSWNCYQGGYLQCPI